EYVPQLDNQSVDDDMDPSLTFVIREFNSRGDFIANAFFPNDPPYKRKLFIDPRFFTMQESKAGVLRHELGHVLGFRHEHIWSAAESCKGEGIIDGYLGARQQTAYDCYSAMHYPCGGCGTLEMKLTQSDIAGAQKIYGKPRIAMN
ncbi:M57 family metalloprotease, partial [Pedobacter sp. HMWF019]|uniref:M57 family metalloprotease n=1 Tax=Pedobacter sp. HMWF019 TaxID=2056856 RepID=UPI0018EE48D4